MAGERGKEQKIPAKLTEIEGRREIHVGGATDIENDVIAAVAGVAAREVEGVASLGTGAIRSLVEKVGGREHRARGVDVEAGQREAILDLDLNVVYGFNIPEVVVKVRQNVARRVLEICGLAAKEINIDVKSIEFPERLPGRVD